MRHLHLFEAFISKKGRDLFGLWHTITLSNGFELTGPIEYADEVNKIARKINGDFLVVDYDNYGAHERILQKWESTLADYEYTHPEYRVAVLEHASDGSSISIYFGKEYVTIDPETEEEANDGNWWRAAILDRAKSLGATHIFDREGEDKLIPIEEY